MRQVETKITIAFVKKTHHADQTPPPEPSASHRTILIDIRCGPPRLMGLPLKPTPNFNLNAQLSGADVHQTICVSPAINHFANEAVQYICPALLDHRPC